jgi:hypothetical protein
LANGELTKRQFDRWSGDQFFCSPVLTKIGGHLREMEWVVG